MVDKKGVPREPVFWKQEDKMKKEIAYPSGIDEIRFMRCFSASSYGIFVALSIGWALTVGKHTVSQVILTMRPHHSRHFATIYRFLGNDLRRVA